MFNDSPHLVTDIENAFTSSELSEALEFASNDLSQTIKKRTLHDNTKSSRQAFSSLMKYFIRLSTRPTPFGLFSGIAIGQFGNKSHITISDIHQHAKRARPDMEWIYGLIKKIEGNKKIRYDLRVRFNDFTYPNGNRIDKPNKTFLQLEQSNENTTEISTSIRYTNQIKILEEKYNDFNTLSSIIDDIVSQNPNVSISRIEGFLVQLLENEYLLSELRPPLINTDMLDYLINALSKITSIDEVDLYIAKLKDIQKLMENYNLTSIGKGIDIYNEITRLQKELYECKSYLQVDMKTHVGDNLLDSSLKNDLEDFASAMYRLAPFDKMPDEMAHYIGLFIEKYGHSAEVPVLELLDIDRGLGSPIHYGNNAISRPVPHRQKTTHERRLKALLERKMILALREGKKAIELNDNDIDVIYEGEQADDAINPMDSLQSFELYLLAHPRAEHKFTIAPAVGSDSFGNSFGRFSDMMTQEESLLLKEGFEKNKYICEGYVIAEICDVPSSGRTSNVTLNNSDYDYQIALTTNPCDDKHTISIRDLYIGVEPTSNNFYIKSKSLNKKVIVTMTSMMNPSFGSSALRFLREVSSMRKKSVIIGILSVLNIDFEYTPRISYGSIIIKPETWVISRHTLGIKDKEAKNSKSVEKCFEQFREKWDVPRYVFFNEGDNRLLLDLDNPVHKNEIYSLVKKNTSMSITLTELGCEFDDYAAVDENRNKYVTEIIVPFILDIEKKARAKTENKENEIILETLSNISENQMKIERDKLMLLPGNSEWLYYKLYGCSKRQSELLSILYESLEKLALEGLVNMYFFIRYTDPEPHLRLRVQPSDNRTSDLFIAMNNLMSSLYSDGLISKSIIDSYVREAERYGGPHLIKQAEEYFYNDSKLVMKLLTMERFGTLKFDMDLIGVSFIVSVLEAFNLTIKEQEAFLDSMTDNKNYRKEYQNNRQLIMTAVDSNDNWFSIRHRSSNPEIYDFINENASYFKKYAEAIYESDKQGELTNSIKDIATSIIHMFCNRFRDNAWERKIYALTRHGVNGLRGYLKHNKSKSLVPELPESLF